METNISNDKSRPRRFVQWGLALVLVTAVILAGIQWGLGANGDAVRYTSQPARRAPLTVLVTATGNLAPTNQVEVGSELSGIVKSVAVTFNDHVEKGEILARLDTTRIEAQVAQSRAALASARAKVLLAKATLAESRTNLSRLAKLRELTGNRTPSSQDMDAARAAADRAEAEVAAAQAAVAQSEAALRINETDLEKSVIRSPVNGIVLSRDVEPGQTVAASLQAPVLFTLAEDLTRMELHVAVDEADVGRVREGQEATFFVDAYPDRRFPARIVQVRYGAVTTDGVVTYETVLLVDNSDLVLRPGMTATADITVEALPDPLLVPNAALRFTPTALENAGKTQERSLVNRLLPMRPRRAAKAADKRSVGPGNQRVWVLEAGHPVPVSVVTGATDGIHTQITGGDLVPGMEVVVGTAPGKGAS